MKSEIWYIEELDETVRVILPDETDWRAYCEHGQAKWGIHRHISMDMGPTGPSEMMRLGFTKIIEIEC